jgi:hypothetical protein
MSNMIDKREVSLWTSSIIVLFFFFQALEMMGMLLSPEIAVLAVADLSKGRHGQS